MDEFFKSQEYEQKMFSIFSITYDVAWILKW